MRNQRKCFLALFLASAAVLLNVVPALSLDDAATANQAVFFSQGQSMDTSQDHDKSRQEAIFDFLSLAVTQAMGRFLSPSEMASRLPDLQESVLKQPERYVETYQIFSENSASGRYRITGQVTVAMDALLKDLKKSGLPVSVGANANREEGPSNEGTADGAADAEQKPTPVAAALTPVAAALTPVAAAATPVKAAAAPSGTVAAPSGTVAAAAEAGNSAREPDRTSRDIFWAVTEKWDQEWVLPDDATNPQNLFAAGAAQELEDFGWFLRFPITQSLDIDNSGNISLEYVLARAGELGIQCVVVGTVSLRQKQGERTRLNAVLRVLSVSSRKSAGEIRKDLIVQEGSNQEAAMALAAAVSPQLDRLLDKAFQTGPPAQAEPSAKEPLPGGPPGVESPSTTSPAPIPAPTDLKPGPSAPEGAWLLKIMARQQFSAWQEMEKLLRERFKSMQVKSLQFGAGEIVAVLEGVDGQFFSSLNGNRFPGGDIVQVDAFSPEERSAKITVLRSEKQEPGAKQ